MTDEEKLVAGKYQLKYFSACQYPLWRVAMIKSVKRILENPDEFYCELKGELRQDDDSTGEKTVHHEIKYGLLFEALSQSIQAIEDLFSMMRNALDIPNFIKNVVVYSAAKAKDYIWNFNTDNLEYIMKQMQLPYCPLDEEWENAEAYMAYKTSVLLIQDYLEKLIAHHKKFYLHYNQYKHGQAIALRPFAKPPEDLSGNMEEAGLLAFDSYRFEKRNKGSTRTPSMMIPHVHPDIAEHIHELHDDDNLLRADLGVVHIDTLIEIAEMSFTLLNAFWANLRTQCELKENDLYVKYHFPIKDYRRIAIIDFPNSD